MLYRTWKLLFPESDFAVSAKYDFVDETEIAPWALETVTYLYDKKVVLGTDVLTISPLVNIPCKDGLTLMARIVKECSPEK